MQFTSILFPCALSVLLLLSAAQPPEVELFKDQQSRINSSSFVFNLLGSKPASVGNGGTMKSLTRKNFPALGLGNGFGGTAGVQNLLTLKPCGIRLPHIHPRGTENFYIIKGMMRANFLREAGTVVTNNITAGYAGYFPMGSLHFLYNPTCSDAVAILMFDNNDPGTVTTVSMAKVITDSFGILFNVTDVGTPLEDVLKSELQQGTECFQRCGLSPF
jgi:oxalate decarboxylase/phosphoglucose isomerase-like protein (cupin superfamily)